jgi:hypothetical protein
MINVRREWLILARMCHLSFGIEDLLHKISRLTSSGMVCRKALCKHCVFHSSDISQPKKVSTVSSAREMMKAFMNSLMFEAF